MSGEVVFITGAQGFVGQLLSHALPRGFRAAPFVGELLDAPGLGAALTAAQPTHIVHLAGISHPSVCDADPARAYTVNTAGTALLCELILKHAPGAHLVFASTAQVYQDPAEIGRALIDETWPVKPQNLYARTKRLGELAILGEPRIRATVLRIFNHTHKSQGPQVFLSYLYAELLKRKSGQISGPIKVGNLENERDLGSVQDLLLAFGSVLRSPPSEEHRVFNVSSGIARKLGTLSQVLMDKFGVTAVLEQDPSRIRAGDPQRIVGDSTKLRELTGWNPHALSDETLIEQFLADLVPGN